MSGKNNLPKIKTALSAIARSSKTKTKREPIKCFFWTEEEQYDENREKIRKDIVLRKFSGMPYLDKLQELNKLQAKTMFVLKLVDPINVTGTKVMNYGGNNISPTVNNCTQIYIPQELRDMNILGYEETDEVEHNMQGQEVPIVLLHLNDCMLDVKEGQRDRLDTSKWIKPAKVFVTDISFKAMQTIGKLMYMEDLNKSKAMNMMTDEALNQLK